MAANRKAKCYFFQNSVSLLWRKYHIYLHTSQILSKKMKKTVFPLGFSVESVIFYWNNEGSCQQEWCFSFAEVNPGLKWQSGIVRPLPWAGTDRFLHNPHCSAPSSCLSPLPHHKRVGVPSGGFTASLLQYCMFSPHLFQRTTIYLMVVVSFRRPRGNQILKLKFSGWQQVLLYSTGN